MRSPLNSPLGVCILPAPARNYARTVLYPDYLHEILRHAGICYETVDPEELRDRVPGLRLLVTVGEGDLGGDVRDRLRGWIETGGAWLSVGGLCGMGETLGAEAEP